MSQTSATEFLSSAKQDTNLREKLKAALDLNRCIEIANNAGFNFTPLELQTELSQLSDEAVAEIMNPGVYPRQHLNPQ
ncbi:Nif11-like leader peptide family natural product precursor [Chlorogloea sp. CCALA 695]|uniref:Nif11-like leader peptide family natural product precursor n=1 Tax=Chlorogloea sp. CCALA 695 TaxID=2107693 RepID=UPI000D07258D|nr:Nif11-like leader peptide family natural product precursor [Chlorogloea sp. CCALA 695]PSB30880.1 Nif11-like leader peptide family natural product precursor [Chlorogloea sp. CCALA 695]